MKNGVFLCSTRCASLDCSKFTPNLAIFLIFLKRWLFFGTITMLAQQNMRQDFVLHHIRQAPFKTIARPEKMQASGAKSRRGDFA